MRYLLEFYEGLSNFGEGQMFELVSAGEFMKRMKKMFHV